MYLQHRETSDLLRIIIKHKFLDGQCQLKASEWRKESLFSACYIFFASVINTLLPMLLLSLFNYSIINLVKERELIYRRLTTKQVLINNEKEKICQKNYLVQARDLTATRVLVWIVISFILSHSLKVVLNTIEIYATLTMNKKGLLSISFSFSSVIFLRTV